MVLRAPQGDRTVAPRTPIGEDAARVFGAVGCEEDHAVSLAEAAFWLVVAAAYAIAIVLATREPPQ